MLHQLLYNSVATKPMDVASLQSMLSAARQHNAAHDISGLLIYEDRTREFLQVLEGPEAAIKTLYDRICRDARHSHLDLLIEGPIAERGFAGWSMGFRLLGSDQPEVDSGYAEIYERGFSAAGQTSSATRAKRLLQNVFATLPGQAAAT